MSGLLSKGSLSVGFASKDGFSGVPDHAPLHSCLVESRKTVKNII